MTFERLLRCQYYSFANVNVTGVLEYLMRKPTDCAYIKLGSALLPCMME